MDNELLDRLRRDVEGFHTRLTHLEASLQARDAPGPADSGDVAALKQQVTDLTARIEQLETLLGGTV